MGARVSGAPPAKDLDWLRHKLDETPGFGPGSFNLLWRRLRRLAFRCTAGPISVALEKPMGEVQAASMIAVCLGLPKILGLDVILAERSPAGMQGPWPWLLEVNRFPALGMRAPSDALIKLPVVRDAWRLAHQEAAAAVTEGLPSQYVTSDESTCCLELLSAVKTGAAIEVGLDRNMAHC